MNWYYALGQQRIGPVPEEQFATLIQQGQITAETLVWNETLTEWKRLMDVRPDLLGAAGAGEEMEFCTVSGKAYPRSQMVQFQGKWISLEHRDDYFQRLREGISAPGQMRYAGFWLRFVAKFIDGILLWIVSAMKSVLLVLAMFGHANIFMPMSNPADNLPLFFGFTAINMLTDIALGLCYSWFFLSKYEATPGKLALGLKVVRADGSKISTLRIIGRFFAEWLSGLIMCIGYIMAGFDDQKRSLHDHICDTRVIKAQK